jgi:carbonic anhydrase
MISHAFVLRLRVMAGVVLCLAAFLAPGSLAAAAAATHAAEPGAAALPTASEALDRLVQGNQRFVEGKVQHPRQNAAYRHGLVGGQKPVAIILGCSDSRVPLELVFDQGFGDLFVIRVAGNSGGTDDLGSIEYAVDHLHTPLVVVLGHENCGAVTAALLPKADRDREDQAIQQLLEEMQPALKGLDPKLSPAERVHQGVEANVRMTVQRLEANEDLMRPHDGHSPRIVGAVYELDSGKVRWLK